MLTLKDLSILLERDSHALRQDLKQNFRSFVTATRTTESAGKRVGSRGSDPVLDPVWLHYLMSKSNVAVPNHHIVVIAALKGGVGKTTLTLNMSLLAAAAGLRVLLVDFDPEACATHSLVDPVPKDALVVYDVLRDGLSLSKAIQPSKYANLDLVPAALRNHKTEQWMGHQNPKKVVANLLREVKGYNLIFLDLPPAFSATTGSAYLAADLIMIPCTPSVFALESVALTVQAIDQLAAEFDCSPRTMKIVMNQFNPKRVAAREVLALLREHHGDRLCSFTIRESAELVNSTNEGRSVLDSPCSDELRESMMRLGKTVFGWGVS